MYIFLPVAKGNKFRAYYNVLGNLDYCKIGHYDDNLGGLDKPTTNQKMLKWNYSLGKWENITYKFQKGYHNDSNQTNRR